jgi:UDP-glucose 4-epimerase
MNILVSGAHGFVGNALCAYLISQGNTVSTVNRNDPEQSFTGNTFDCMINLAARAHVMQETAEDVYRAYADINVGYTLNMARLAKTLNIKRFIFLSSVKVNGECTTTPFTESDSPQPMDDYGRTKLEAEISLKDYCASQNLELVLIRPPLIYGAQVKANFKHLVQICKKTIPLPFGSICNKRSLISLQNLNNFIELCCIHPAAANQTFLISDDHDVSTTELIKTIRWAVGQKPLLFPVPERLLKLTLSLLGKKNLSDRLLGDLQVDITKAKDLLGWKPVINFKDAIHQAVNHP